MTQRIKDKNLNWLLVVFFVILALPNYLFCQTIWCNMNGESKCNSNFSKQFPVYWNIPSQLCHRYKINFAELLDDFCIVHNVNDLFRGNQITILYDPGSFPTLKDDYDRDMIRNGGVPQLGNLTLHLIEFAGAVNKLIPDREYAGLAVIDFEMWRPIFRQLWGKYRIYQKLSIEIERRRHTDWNDGEIIAEASKNFEESARRFMVATLDTARIMRSKAKWGYYDYPFCNNWSVNVRQDQCPDDVVRANDVEMSWLYANISLMLPSIYPRLDLTADQRLGLVSGRVAEATRIASKRTDRDNVAVLPYYWYRFHEENVYVDKLELENTFRDIIKNGGDGVILWGHHKDFDSKSKCEAFFDFVRDDLGPAVLSVKPVNNHV